ncbi:cupin domain-containing protein [Litoribrevibacter euphylliae]|uniref:Cupin domain-containing protein n=1 Tax=Litoribrevibacter euphylliae TaxID=1834034 RepID=A0ABV7HDG2_9GAMM
MDTLSDLLQGVDVRAEVFFSGNLCGLQSFEEEGVGHLHFLKSGQITVKTEDGHELTINQSSVLFFPKAMRHSINVDAQSGAELVCASIHFPAKQIDFLRQALPKFIYIDIESGGSINTTTQSIFDEAFKKQPGYQLLIDRQCDVFMVQLLRHVVDIGIVSFGMIAGSTHPRLMPLMEMLKKQPEYEWTVEEMAETVAMSRSKFSALFKETVGQAPLDYLTDLRMALAKGLLKNNKPVGLVANSVGYENASTLSRVFKRRFGVTPKQWIKNYLNQ